MATTTAPAHAPTGPALDNRRIAAAAIDMAAPVLAGAAIYAADLVTPAVVLVLVAWILYYFFALESGGGQTVGKRAMRLKVVSADGGEPTMRQCALRTVTRVVDMPVIGLAAMLATGDRRQRLGDIAAQTSVVDADTTRDIAVDVFDTASLRAEPQAPKARKPKRSRPGLGGPELKLPSLRRSKGPKPPKPAKSKNGRPTLGGPELKLPSLRRRKPEPTVFEPGPVIEPPAPGPVPTRFDPFADDAPEPSVEVVGRDELEPAAHNPEPPVPDLIEGDAPEVEIVREDFVEEHPAPAPAPAASPLPEPAPEVEPEPHPEPEHVEGIRDDGSSRVNVKPIETVSAMELLMREAEEHPTGGHRQDRK